MTIATWNVNSLKVRLPHVLDWLASEKPDALCLQETKNGRFLGYNLKSRFRFLQHFAFKRTYGTSIQGDIRATHQMSLQDMNTRGNDNLNNNLKIKLWRMLYFPSLSHSISH